MFIRHTTCKTAGINHYIRHVEHPLTGASRFHQSTEVQFRGSQSSTADYTLYSFPWQPKRFEIVGSPLGEEWNMILIFLSALQPYIPTPAAFLIPCLRYGIAMSGMCGLVIILALVCGVVEAREFWDCIP